MSKLTSGFVSLLLLSLRALGSCRPNSFAILLEGRPSGPGNWSTSGSFMPVGHYVQKRGKSLPIPRPFAEQAGDFPGFGRACGTIARLSQFGSSR